MINCPSGWFNDSIRAFFSLDSASLTVSSFGNLTADLFEIYRDKVMSDFLPDYFGPIKSELRLRILTNLKILTNLVTKLEFIFRSI